jgi:hypothetical protein
VDHIPLPPRKNRHLLTFIDHFTKYAEAIPLTDMSAETCARAYVTHVIARLNFSDGPGKVIHLSVFQGNL